MRRLLLVPVILLALAAGAPAADTAAWRIARGDVRVVCPLTVGGTFEARTTTISGTLVPVGGRPAAFAGAVAVDLRTLETGIGLRNEHMRNEYLEVGKGEGYQAAVLSDVDLGDVAADTIRGKTRFTGTLLLHGVKKPVAGQAEVRREGSAVRVDAAFPITLADYAIKEPRYLGVGVKDVVQVKVTLTAAPDAAGVAR
jgi:polyisoprenoid-binding protein YceI